MDTIFNDEDEYEMSPMRLVMLADSLFYCANWEGVVLLTGEFLEFVQQFRGVGAIRDVFADIFVGDIAVFVDDEDRGRGDTVVVEIVDFVVAGNFMAIRRVEDGKGGTRVCNHGSRTTEVVHA